MKLRKHAKFYRFFNFSKEVVSANTGQNSYQPLANSIPIYTDKNFIFRLNFSGTAISMKKL